MWVLGHHDALDPLPALMHTGRCRRQAGGLARLCLAHSVVGFCVEKCRMPFRKSSAARRCLSSARSSSRAVQLPRMAVDRLLQPLLCQSRRLCVLDNLMAHAGLCADPHQGQVHSVLIDQAVD